MRLSRRSLLTGTAGLAGETKHREPSGAAQWFLNDTDLQFQTDLSQVLSDEGIYTLLDLAEIQKCAEFDRFMTGLKRGEKARWRRLRKENFQALQNLKHHVYEGSLTMQEWMRAVPGIPAAIVRFVKEEALGACLLTEIVECEELVAT